VGGGADNLGTVFEIAKTATGYASAPTTLVSFDGSDGEQPEASLVADANGDLFGTTRGGAASGNDGSVFEIAKTSTGYASAPTTLVTFNGSDGQWPYASLMADANGDLFGTTSGGGVSDGTVFEIAKTATGYASSPTTLVSSDGADGKNPLGELIADANGDLFGTASAGGMFGEGTSPGYGTVFEIAKTATGYASSPTTLVNFDGADGEYPVVGLIADANGDLFGTTKEGGAYGDGTVFEIAKTTTGYASAPTTLASFDGSDGLFPESNLIADANGDLLGLTSGSASTFDGLYTLIDSTAFEVTGSGFVPPVPVQPASIILWRNSSTGGVELWSPNGSGGFTYESLGVVNSSWQIEGTGDFAVDGDDGILWRNSSTGGVELWNSNGSGGFAYESLGVIDSSWQIAGTGDFTGNGEDGILWRNSSTGGLELWNPNGSGGFAYENLGVVNSSWEIAGTGDFTGGGADSILWRNASTGGVELWNSNGSGGFTYESLGVVDSSWEIAGTGDFTGGGADSILWRNSSTGGVELWNSNGSGGFTYENLSVVPTSWQILKQG
jgi:hypothetical protein